MDMQTQMSFNLMMTLFLQGSPIYIDDERWRVRAITHTKDEIIFQLVQLEGDQQMYNAYPVDCDRIYHDQLISHYRDQGLLAKEGV